MKKTWKKRRLPVFLQSPGQRNFWNVPEKDLSLRVKCNRNRDVTIRTVRFRPTNFQVVNDFEKLRELFGRMLGEIQRIKSEGDYEAGRELVERYAVKVAPTLHGEVLERYAALNIEPYGGFVNPEFELVEQDGKVVDVKISYPNNYVEQMLGYSKNYSYLPNIN